MADFAWTEEQMTLLKAMTAKNFAYNIANITPEQTVIADAEIARFTSGDQEFIGAKMAEIAEHFAQADANGDGRLNQAESNEYFRL